MPSPIIQVGLDVLPAIMKFDYKQLKEVQQFHHDWTIEGVDRFWDYILNDAVVVGFEQTMGHLKYKDCRFGVLSVIDKSKKLINVNEKLVESEVALGVRKTEEFWKLYMKTTTPVIQKWNDCFRSGGVLKDKMGISVLPNFEKIFQKILYPAPIELNPQMKKINEKVMGWLSENAGVDGEPPEDFTEFEDKADSDYLFELYGSGDDNDEDDDDAKEPIDEDNKEVQLTREQVRIELEKINLKEKCQNIPKIAKVLQKKPIEFLPGGYQVSTVIQGSPKKFKARSKPKNIEYDDDEFVSASNFAQSDHDINDEEIEKW